jgi:hypothetical protein
MQRKNACLIYQIMLGWNIRKDPLEAAKMTMAGLRKEGN